MKEIDNKSILEVGSYDANGTIRPVIEKMNPAEYIGVDLHTGPSVDIVCKAEKLVECFGKERFDVVISTEMIEHVLNWREVINNIKEVCKPGGIILITTRSPGFPFHACPYDFWRYEPEDMKAIFEDMEILTIERDYLDPGVFVKVMKPQNYVRRDLSEIKLYSTTEHQRVKKISVNKYRAYIKRYQLIQVYFRISKQFEVIRSKIFRSINKVFQKLGA